MTPPRRPDRRPPRRTRGERIRDFCAREGVCRQTVWNWARKGVVQLSRLDRAVGVRVSYTDPTWNSDE